MDFDDSPALAEFRAEVRAFLDEHAEVMPRTMLRYAIEHLDPPTRAHYLGTKRRAAGLS